MTKEEIIKKHYERTFGSENYHKRVNKVMDEKWIGGAMEEYAQLYAKQQAIEFHTWCIHGNGIGTPWQQYTQFIEQQNKHE